MWTSSLRISRLSTLERKAQSGNTSQPDLYSFFTTVDKILTSVVEFFFQRFPDEDYFKKPLPPPMGLPGERGTDDEDLFEAFNSATGRMSVDSGLVHELHYDIVDGKRVFKKFAGVNQSMTFI